MFCYIHEGGENIGSRIICIEIDEHMSHDEFRLRVCVTLNMQQDLVKIEFTFKFDPSLFIILWNDATFLTCSVGMIFIIEFMFLHLNVRIVTSPQL